MVNPDSSQQIQVKLTDDVLRGAYANMAMVSQSPSGEEFVIDFMNVMPPAGIVNARVIMSPGHFKRLVSAMGEQLKKHEEQFGVITAAEQPDHHLGFRTE